MGKFIIAFLLLIGVIIITFIFSALRISSWCSRVEEQENDIN